MHWDPLMWSIVPLVPADFQSKQSVIMLPGLDVPSARCLIISSPPQVPVAQQPEKSLHRFTTAKLISEPIILPRGRYYVFSKPSLSHRIRVDAPLRWPSYCLNGFQAVMWNGSFEKGTHLNEDKVIKLQQLSLDLCFFLDCLRWKCVPHMFQG